MKFKLRIISEETEECVSIHDSKFKVDDSSKNDIVGSIVVVQQGVKVSQELASDSKDNYRKNRII